MGNADTESMKRQIIIRSVVFVTGVLFFLFNEKLVCLPQLGAA